MEMPEVKFGEEAMSLTADQAVLHTGTSLTVIPESDFQVIIEYLSQNHPIDFINYMTTNYAEWQVDCWSLECDELPPLRITLGDYELEFDNTEYLTGPLNTFIFQPSATSEDWLLGNEMMSKYYLILDAGNQRVGMVEATEVWNLTEYLTGVVFIIVALLTSLSFTSLWCCLRPRACGC